MFKERLWPRKSNKNIAFVGKERKEIFFWRNQEEFSNNKIKLGKVIQQNITEEFTFVNRTAD